MSRSNYDVKETYTGTGSLDEYTFDFKIEELTQLLVIEVNASGVETQRVRGDDTTYLSSVDYDVTDGGGTVTLAANLPSGYSLILLLANDSPTQPYEFSNKQSFNLRRFEAAFDWLAGAIQRLSYLSKQAFRIHDLDDEEAIDLQLPPGFADNAGKPFIVNLAGDGLDYGTSIADLEAATAAAQDDATQAIAAAAAIQAEFDAFEASTTRYIVGSEAVNNSWRFRQVSGNLVMEKRIAGVWTIVDSYNP